MKLVAKNGDSLRVAVTLHGAWRLLSELDVDLLNPGDQTLYDRYLADPFFRADVLTVLIETGAARAVSTVEAAALIENTPGDSADELAEDIRLFAPDEKDLPKSDGADRDRQPYDPYDLWKTVWRLAGGVGVDWRELSLRQLWYMADGAQRAAWSIASAVMALIANCNRDSKSHPRPFTPDEFSPFADKNRKKKSAIPHSKQSMDMLGGMLNKMFKR